MKMLDVLFFSALAVYFFTVLFQFGSLAFRREKLRSAAWIFFVAAFILNGVYLIARGIAAGRIPFSNQFEFAVAFAWCIALIALFMRRSTKDPLLGAITSAASFLVISFAALQPRTISDLMPALRSAWFGFHIGSAVISYSSFVISACLAVRYLLLEKKDNDDGRLGGLDYLSYRLIAFGFLMLTITILTGAIWAEQAWSAFWTWDPKETWALITWLIYAAYLHLRLNKKRRGRRMAIFSIAGVVCVLFTFIGVNALFSGLHSYK